MTIQTKTALLFTLLTAGILLLVSLTVYFFTSRYVSNDFLKRLEFRAVLATRIHFDHDTSGALIQLRKQDLEVLPDEREYILPYNGQSRILPDSLPPIISLKFIEEIVAASGETVFRHNRHIHYAGVYHTRRSGAFVVIKSAVNEHGVKALMNLKKVLIISFLSGVCMVFTISIFFSKKTFAPVRKIITRAKDISAHNLHLRIEYDEGADEISEIASTFNNMLDRLETAFETQNNFISNASHELRTPLTTIIGEADIALSRSRSAEDYRQSLQVILKEAGKLHNLTSSLLTLAQSGFDGKKQEWSSERIDELLFMIHETLSDRYPDNHVEIDMDGLPEDESLLTVEGNANLLRLAIINVIVNGCKYSNNKPVRVSLGTEKNRVLITIEDQGIGIPDAELKYIYEPFFRASNSNRFEGYGVGLPLTKAIIKLHHGQIHVNSREGTGTTVIISLPVAPMHHVAHSAHTT